MSEIDPSVRADQVDVDRQVGVTVVFSDGVQWTFANADLRAACPCAECRGLRDLGQSAWPRPGGRDVVVIVDAALVGAWGINITWDDGHSTGIYPWASLREWAQRARDNDGESR